jgi:hypothetical protein
MREGVGKGIVRPALPATRLGAARSDIPLPFRGGYARSERTSGRADTSTAALTRRQFAAARAPASGS